MRNQTYFRFGFFLLVLYVLCVGIINAQTTEFTYQGRLSDNNMPANANYDFEFRLYDASNNLLGTQTRLGVSVTNGAFTVGLDFGASPNLFTGAARLLEIAVRPAGSGSYTPLNPRQPITSAPYAIRSREATTADTALNSNQLGGIPSAQFVQTDAGGNASIGGNLTVGGNLTQNTVNSQTEYQIGGQRVFSVAGENLFLGLRAGASNTNGFRNSFAGTEGGFSNTTGVDNSYFGFAAGRTGTSSVGNSFFGVEAGRNNTANGNSFFGRSAGFDNTTGGFNAFFGFDAGRFNTGGGLNSFFGYYAGRSNIDANYNSFFGSFAGTTNTSGDSNSFVGDGAGFANTTGRNNSFFGRLAGFDNTGSNNSFVGRSAGRNNSTGSNNLFVGVNAGDFNLTGNNNTALGNDADVGANNLNFATALGAGAIVGDSNSIVLGRTLDTVRIPGNLNLTGSFTGNFTVPATNITGVLSVANGGTGLNATGAAGNFLRSNGSTWTSSPFSSADIPDASITAPKIASGQVVKSLNNLTDNVTLTAGSNITITPSGNTLTISATGGGGGGNAILNQTELQTGANFNIDGTGSANIFSAGTQFNLGTERVLFNDFDLGNLFVGIQAGRDNAGGDSNTFVGDRAGRRNTTACCNSFFGNVAGANNTTGIRNSFFGDRAGLGNSVGDDNSYFGSNSGRGGDQNSFFGSLTGGSNEGIANSFFGFAAGRLHIDGSFNVFVGQAAGEFNTGGAFNTFVGAGAGKNNNQGGNSFFGYNAGLTNTTGQSITLIGAGADVAVDNLIYATAIGVGAKVDASNTIALGRPGGFDTVYIPGSIQVNSLGSAGSTNLCRNAVNKISTCSSSIRYKTNVNNFDSGLDLVRRLRPVSFNWKADGKLDLGLVAEEVAEAEPLLVNFNDQGEVEGVKYDRVGVVLLNAVKEQQTQIETQAKQIDEQKQMISRQTEQINRQEIKFQKQQTEIEALKTLVCSQNLAAMICKTKDKEEQK